VIRSTALFGITAVRLGQDGWVESALIGEISPDGDDFVQGSIAEREAGEIATMIKTGCEIYCVFGRADELGPRFEVIQVKHRGDVIKLVDDLPERGLQQLIQLDTPWEGQNNPLGSW
jgi:hypothetical protein